MPEISHDALDFLDVLVSEGLSYPLGSSLLGQLSTELFDAGYVYRVRGKKPSVLPPSLNNLLSLLKLFQSGRQLIDLEDNLGDIYFLEPTEKGINHLDKLEEGAYLPRIGLAAAGRLYDLVLEGKRHLESPHDLESHYELDSQSDTLLEAGYAEVFEKITHSPPFINVDFSPNMSSGIQNIPPLFQYFLIPTKDGRKYIEKLEELAEF